MNHAVVDTIQAILSDRWKRHIWLKFLLGSGFVFVLSSSAPFIDEGILFNWYREAYFEVM